MNPLLLLCYQALLIPAGLAALLGRFLRGKPLPGLRQRLGWYPEELQAALRSLRRPIWIHTVSVGEVIAAQPLILELRRRLPDRDWVITTVTPTGQAMAKRLVRDSRDRLLYLPWDFAPIVRRAVRAIRPELFISFETELWPVLLDHLKKSGVPILVVNGRISPAAYRRYLWVRPFMERALASVTFFLTQSPQDAHRYAALGAPKDRISVTGNLKWDLEALGGFEGSASGHFPDLKKLFPGITLWTAGSTHPGEERTVLQAYRLLKGRYPSLRLLIAPRHPERIPEVEREAKAQGLGTVRRSELGSSPRGDDPVILLDTLGELLAAYRMSDLVFVGGSLVPHGGHNLIEPAALKKPILAGPHLQNFHAIAESLSRAGGIIIVRSPPELEKAVGLLLADPTARQALGSRAHQAVLQHRGAVDRTVETILKILNTSSRGPGRIEAISLRTVPGILLSIGAALYGAALAGIALLYRVRMLPVHRLPVAVISVGNLTWGGTGKTSLVMQLARALKQRGRSPAVLLRGYGGDEARLLAERLHPIPVLAQPDRAAAGTKAVKEFGADLLLLDDGYQQWRLKKDLEILMVDATAPFGNGHLIPRGNLREPIQAAARADLIVVTRADLNPRGLRAVEHRIREVNAKAPIFFARYRPVEFKRWPASPRNGPVRLEQLRGERVCALAGIAGPGQFEATVKGLDIRIAMSHQVRDHHLYTVGELARLLERCRQKGIRRIITTAKDAVRIPKRLIDAVGPDLKGQELLVLEVVLEFEPNESELLHRIDTLLPR